MAGRCDGKVVMVTGAGSGIGRATAMLFGEEGASVVAADIEETGSATARIIEEGGGRATAVRGSVSDAGDASRMVEAAVAAYGKLDILANVVGGSRPGHTVVELPEEDWERLIGLNLRSVFLMCKFAVP